ncbi:MAG: hypothetical protein AAGF12_00685 [Myxococcota bacterium]
MTDSSDKKHTDLELDDEEFNWDDALAEWEHELEDKLSEPPAADAPVAASPPQPLYRPPSLPAPEPAAPLPVPPAPETPAGLRASEPGVADLFHDDDDEQTSLLTVDDQGLPMAVDLDLEALLSDDESDPSSTDSSTEARPVVPPVVAPPPLPPPPAIPPPRRSPSLPDGPSKPVAKAPVPPAVPPPRRSLRKLRTSLADLRAKKAEDDLDEPTPAVSAPPLPMSPQAVKPPLPTPPPAAKPPTTGEPRTIERPLIDEDDPLLDIEDERTVATAEPLLPVPGEVDRRPDESEPALVLGGDEDDILLDLEASPTSVGPSSAHEDDILLDLDTASSSADPTDDVLLDLDAANPSTDSNSGADVDLPPPAFPVSSLPSPTGDRAPPLPTPKSLGDDAPNRPSVSLLDLDAELDAKTEPGDLDPGEPSSLTESGEASLNAATDHFGDSSAPEPIATEGLFDDEETAIGTSFDESIDDLLGLDEAAEAVEIAEPAPEPPPVERRPDDRDAGAQAAKRSVRYRKPRQESFPLVGRGTAALRARREMLKALSGNARGPSKARLLSAAAELDAQLGEPSSRDLFAEARREDPEDLIALRELRRSALADRDYSAAAELLEAEAKLPLSVEDRTFALLYLAELYLHHLDDMPAAEKAARTALGLTRGSVGAALYLAEASYRNQREAEHAMAVDRAVDNWQDSLARGALLTHLAATAEARRQTERARSYYGRAVEEAPAVENLSGLARTARTTDDPDAAVTATLQLAVLLRESPIADLIRRHAAKLVHALGRPGDAATLLQDAKHVYAHVSRADAAKDAQETQTEVDAIEAWAQATGGTDRALALTLLAERRADAGDLDLADTHLRAAAEADDKLGTVQVVRELIARRAGDQTRLANAVSSHGHSLAAAAKLAASPEAANEERELLRRAREDQESPATVDVINLDAAAALGDSAGVLDTLRRQADRVVGERKLGPFLLLAESAAENGDRDAAEVLLESAREVLPGNPLALRPLGRLLASGSPEAAAMVWLEEASHAPAERAAFAATQAGLLLGRASQETSSPFIKALESEPNYLPAVWSAAPICRREGDVETLADLNERLADAEVDKKAKAARLTRAALLRAADRSRAAELLQQAREAVPEDAVIYELLLRLGDGMDAAGRAAVLEQAAEHADAELGRAFLLRAALSLEEAGEYGRAAKILRSIVANHGDDIIALRALERCELRGGEIARVAERRFDAVRTAESDSDRARALQALADLDWYERDDAASAILSYQSLLEVDPLHLPTLLALERYFMDQGRDEDLIRVETSIVRSLQTGPDVNAHVRFLARLILRQEEARGDAADEVILEAQSRAELDRWLLRRVLGAAYKANDQDTERAITLLAVELADQPEERAGTALRAANAALAVDQEEAAVEVLEKAFEASPSYPTVAERVAELRHRQGRKAEAAEAYQLAARAARVDAHACSLWYRAGRLWQNLERTDEAREAFWHASEHDTTHRDLFDRLRALLIDVGDKERLATLTERRLQAGGEVAVLTELHGALAELRMESGAREEAKQSLRAALSLDPTNVDKLRALADLCLEDQDWRGAAEALIRIARLRKDREELRWVFFTLGDIYDAHMPDPRRAEAAFKRVLKLIPNDTDAMERLTALFDREGNHAAAAEMLSQLAAHEVDPDKRREHRLRLSSMHEAQGDLRRAESVLEETRRASPVDTAVLRALAEFYRRQNAQSALSMHLNRAVNDFRHAIQTDASDVAAWPGLVEVLNWRGRPDAARACASVAASLGVQGIPELDRFVDGTGSATGAGKAGTDPELDELLAPPELSRVTRAVFRLAADALEKALAFDLRELRVEKLSSRQNPFREAIAHVAPWFGLSDIQIIVTPEAPRVCVPVSGEPTVLIGSEILQRADEAQRRFLLVRAVKIARSRMSVAVSRQPGPLALALAGLARFYDSNFAPPDFNPRDLDEMARRVGRAVHRRVRDELMPLVIEMVGAQAFDPTRLGFLVSQFGDRAALLATGSAPAGIDALLLLAGSQLGGTQAAKVAAVRRVPEAAALVEYGISDVHFEARHRAGLDRA